MTAMQSNLTQSTINFYIPVLTAILNCFQNHYKDYDVCRLDTESLVKFLEPGQMHCIKALFPQALIPCDVSPALFIRPYKDEYSQRFVVVGPALYNAFQDMTLDCLSSTKQTLIIESGYRSTQYQIFIYLKALYDVDFQLSEQQLVMVPHLSEHAQLPFHAVDLKIKEHKECSRFELTGAYEWLSHNAANYGFTLSYPKDNTLGISFEPWHWLYQRL